MYEIDEQQIRKWWQVFKNSGKLVEIRLLGKNTYSGYFNDVETLISQIKPLLDANNAQYYGNLQAYFTLNDINADLYSREQRNVFIKKPKSTTTDGDIVRRKLVLIDLDPNRASGISASDEEFEKAHLKAVDVYRYLMNEGFKEPLITKSGNGWHLYLACDMPNDDEHNDLTKRFLQSLSKMFSDENVEIDEKVYNPARIDKLIGTWAKKGANSSDRPWRLATIVKVPSDMSSNDDDLFVKVANLLPKEEPKQAPNKPNRQYNNTPFDLSVWLGKHNIVYKEEKQGNGTKYVLQHCPWEETHSNKQEWDSALFQNIDGQITFNCFHSHCKDKTWFDFRTFYEPDAYNKPTYQPQQVVYVQQPIPVKPKYEIKEQIPELGEKWLSLSSVKKKDLTQLERVKTGYIELDKRITGLFMSEVTILSGSNSSGKSSWLNSLLLNIIEQGYKVALWSGELPAYILKTWIQMPAAGARNLMLSKFEEGRYFVPDNIGKRIDEWFDGKFFLYNNDYGTKLEQIMHDMEILLKAGVKIFILDNLMSMDIDLFDGDKNSKQKSAILRIKDFAMTNQTHVILVAHPRKAMAFLRKNDISGTADISNAVDNVFIMHRVNEDFIHAVTDFYGANKVKQFLQYGNVLSVEKNRMYGVVDFMCGLHYDIISRRFKNTQAEDVHYGWESQGVQTTFETQQQLAVQTPIQAPPPPQQTMQSDDYAYPWDGQSTNDAPF